MAERAHITPNGSPLPLTFINLADHADGELLRLCTAMVKLEDQWQAFDGLPADLAADYWARAERIAAIHPKTVDGFQMKAMFALAMLAADQRQVGAIVGDSLSMWTGAVAIVHDVLEGLPQ